MAWSRCPVAARAPATQAGRSLPDRLFRSGGLRTGGIGLMVDSRDDSTASIVTSDCRARCQQVGYCGACRGY